MIKREKDPSLDPEITLLDDTQEQLHQQGFSLPRVWTANFLVALKSKPLMILIGPPEAEKEALVEGFSKVLMGRDSYQYQPMLGHPWWASQTADVATFTQTQSRFNTLKLEIMIEEAGLPGGYTLLISAGLAPVNYKSIFQKQPFNFAMGS